MTRENVSRAAVLSGPGRIAIEKRPVPTPGPEEVRLTVRMAGICATDLALLTGSYETTYPLVPGHEGCGTVDAVGEAVPATWLGKMVVPEINLHCRMTGAEPCPACRREMPAHCLNRRALGIHGADGLFADHVIVPVRCLHEVPESMPLWSAVQVEPLAAALAVFMACPVSPGDTVVVLGAGRLGLLVCRAARSFGAKVIAVSRSSRSRQLALRSGAELALDATSPGDVARVGDRTEGLGADVVVECTGSPGGLAAAVPLTRSRGTIVVKTTCGEPAEGLETTEIVVREIRILGSRCGPYPAAIERLAHGQVPVDDYVAGVYPLEDVESALSAAGRATKILLAVNP